jgi:hypothetical protein
MCSVGDGSEVTGQTVKTQRHRLNRDGDRDANSALYCPSSLYARRRTHQAYGCPAGPPKGCPNARAFAASNATSPASCTTYSSRQPRQKLSSLTNERASEARSTPRPRSLRL